MDAKENLATIYFRELAQKHQLPFIELSTLEPRTDLLDNQLCDDYIKFQAIPIAFADYSFTIATANPSKKNQKKIKQYWGENINIVIASAHEIIDCLSKTFSQEYLHRITYKLYEKNPIYSAKQTFNSVEKIVLFSFFLGFAIPVIQFHYVGWLMLSAFLSTGTLVAWLYKLFLSIVGFSIPLSDMADINNIGVQEYPVYTILIALFNENIITINNLLQSLEKIDYPKDKLDIKLLLEHHDEKTLAVFNEITLPFYMQILRVPTGVPQTKPRALNYGLEFALGEYITIYDAEDRPDVLQLKKALQKFNNSDKDVICIQCSLNFYNPRENLLTKLFTLEYALWFDLYLPALSELKAPIPLGGTSNHFNTKLLRKLGEWDPFNVTEDADLGMRLHVLGYKVKTIYSTTYEEATCKLKNWLGQRSRWVKGYMQTYLVHMRRPFKLIKQIGIKDFLNFQLFVGGSIFAILSVIPLCLIFIAIYVFGADQNNLLFTPALLYISAANFIIGNIVILAVNFIAAARRRLYYYLPYILFMPFYWILISLASYIALFELFFRPGYWYKTQHGVSKVLLENITIPKNFGEEIL